MATPILSSSRIPGAALPIPTAADSRLESGDRLEDHSETSNLGNLRSVTPALAPAHGSVPSTSGGLDEPVKKLRQALHGLFRLESTAEWHGGLANLHLRIQWFTRFARERQLATLSRLSSTLERHVTDLYRTNNRTVSATTRPLVQAIDLLVALSQCPRRARSISLGACSLLLVDGTTSSRLEIAQATHQAGIRTVGAGEYRKALRIAAEQRFSHVIINFAQAMSNEGLQMCSALRRLPQGQDAFVIAANVPPDLDYLTRAATVGCSELVSGPVSSSDLALRVLTQALWAGFLNSAPN